MRNLNYIMSQSQHTTKYQFRPVRGPGGGRGNMLARGVGEKAKDFRGGQSSN
jgi:hypothetical protein